MSISIQDSDTRTRSALRAARICPDVTSGQTRGCFRAEAPGKTKFEAASGSSLGGLLQTDSEDELQAAAFFNETELITRKPATGVFPEQCAGRHAYEHGSRDIRNRQRGR
jgi:hypothetical protein